MELARPPVELAAIQPDPACERGCFAREVARADEALGGEERGERLDGVQREVREQIAAYETLIEVTRRAGNFPPPPPQSFTLTQPLPARVACRPIAL